MQANAGLGGNSFFVGKPSFVMSTITLQDRRICVGCVSVRVFVCVCTHTHKG